MSGWRVGQVFDMDGRPAIVTKISDRLDWPDPGGLRFSDHEGRPAVAVDWESTERLPDGSPRRLGRMIR